MKKLIKFLVEVIYDNSTFMNVCDVEQTENPGAKFPYKKYFTSLGEIQLAKRILRIISQKENIIPKSYKEQILSNLTSDELTEVERIEVEDVANGFRNSVYKQYKSVSLRRFIDEELDFTDDSKCPQFKVTIWAYSYWYNVTPTKVYKYRNTPIYDESL